MADKNKNTEAVFLYQTVAGSHMGVESCWGNF